MKVVAGEGRDVHKTIHRACSNHDLTPAPANLLLLPALCQEPDVPGKSSIINHLHDIIH